MIIVCDAPMGTGKTRAAIRMMDANTDKRYIFVTPYLNEVTRIEVGCKNNLFFSPIGEETSKLAGLHALLSQKCNVATTHKLFTYFTNETYQLIQAGGYTLVLDEAMATFSLELFHSEVIASLEDLGLIMYDENDFMVLSRKIPSSSQFGEIGRIENLLRNGSMQKYSNGASEFLWTLNADAFTMFDDVYILTYMFESQLIYYWMKKYNLDYTKIGVKRAEDNDYHFCETFEAETALPGVNFLVNILLRGRVNKVGAQNSALSVSWYNKQCTLQSENADTTGIEQLRKNLLNIYTHVLPAGSRSLLWTCWKKYEPFINPKIGKTVMHVSCNCRGTNDYRNFHCAAYLVNVYMNPKIVKWIKKSGITVDEDAYALSEMIQWIWRTAIRCGEEILVYIPSMRMRHLFMKWLDDVSAGDRLYDRVIEKDLRSSRIKSTPPASFVNPNGVRMKRPIY